MRVRLQTIERNNGDELWMKGWWLGCGALCLRVGGSNQVRRQTNTANNVSAADAPNQRPRAEFEPPRARQTAMIAEGAVIEVVVIIVVEGDDDNDQSDRWMGLGDVLTDPGDLICLSWCRAFRSPHLLQKPSL